MARSASATVASTSTRNRAVLLIAAVFALLSAALMFAFLNSRDDGTSSSDIVNAGGGFESVVVLTRDVGVGQEITSDMVRTASVPAAALLDGRVTDVESVVGKVATAPLYAGEQVIDAKVTTYAGQDSLAYKVPDNMRALSLEVSHEAWINAGLVQPGDRVDVLGITTLEKVDPLTGEVQPQTVSGFIAQDVEVLAVSQSLTKFVPNLDQKAADSTAAGADGAATGDDAATADTSRVQPEDGDDSTYETSISVTLALPPDLAAKVSIVDAMKDDLAQWRIVARQKGDDSPVDGQVTWTFEDIFTLN